MNKLTRKTVDSLVKTRGFRMTPQRLAIVEYLQNADHHPTAEEILAAVNGRFPTTSRATVYNTLNWLKEARLVTEIVEDGTGRFDPNLSPHHHFVCRKCGRVEDVAWNDIPPLASVLPGRQVIETYELTLRGLCARCAK